MANMKGRKAKSQTALVVTRCDKRGGLASLRYASVPMLGIVLLGVLVAVSARSRVVSHEPSDTGSSSHYDLLAMAPEQFATADVATVNLLCAKGLPGTESVDTPAVLRKLDEWAGRVRAETERHLYRASDPRYAEHYGRSEARLRAEFLVQVLQEDCGVRYNQARIRDVDFANPADLFIHGMVSNGNGGTCASMPVLYAAVGRRLGYPIKLVLAKQHVFCRWDDKERFNIEGTATGGVDFLPDEHYRSWPEAISDREMGSGEFLKSLTPQEELAVFLLTRGSCLRANGRHAEALACNAEAHRLMPKAITPLIALWSSLAGAGVEQASADIEQQRYMPWDNPALPAGLRNRLRPPPDPSSSMRGLGGGVGVGVQR